MNASFKIVRSDNRIELVEDRQGRLYLGLLAIEMVFFALYFPKLAQVALSPADMLVPLVAWLAVAAWTASHIAANTRVAFDLNKREARLVRSSAITGRQRVQSIPFEAIEAVMLEVAGERRRRWNPYAMKLVTKQGDTVVLSSGATMLAYAPIAREFTAAAGLRRTVTN